MQPSQARHGRRTGGGAFAAAVPLLHPQPPSVPWVLHSAYSSTIWAQQGKVVISRVLAEFDPGMQGPGGVCRGEREGVREALLAARLAVQGSS